AERAQRGEDAAVFLAVRAQLEAITLADGQRQFQCIDRIQAQAVVEQRRFRVDIGGLKVFQVQAVNQQLGQFEFSSSGSGHGVSGKTDKGAQPSTIARAGATVRS